MTKPPSRLKNRDGDFMQVLSWMYLSYDKF